MNNKNYIEKISAKVVAFAKYFRVIRLLVIIAYLFYLETLVVNVFSSVEYVPGINEVRAKFSPIKAKEAVIISIERYFSDKENNLADNMQNQTANNPFLPFRTEDPGITNNPSAPVNNISENNVIN